MTDREETCPVANCTLAAPHTWRAHAEEAARRFDRGVTDREQYLATVLPKAARDFLAAARAEHEESHCRHSDPCECEYDGAIFSIIDQLITAGVEGEREWAEVVRERDNADAAIGDFKRELEAAEARLTAVREWRRVNSRILDERMILRDLDRILDDAPTGGTDNYITCQRCGASGLRQCRTIPRRARAALTTPIAQQSKAKQED